MNTQKITAYRNLTTGELAPTHQIGTDDRGRPLYQSVEGYEPVDPYEITEDGYWVADVSSAALTARPDHSVADAVGGIWHPSDEARAEIEVASDPSAKAIEICLAEPMRGTWHD